MTHTNKKSKSVSDTVNKTALHFVVYLTASS